MTYKTPMIYLVPRIDMACIPYTNDEVDMVKNKTYAGQGLIEDMTNLRQRHYTHDSQDMQEVTLANDRDRTCKTHKS